MSTTVIDVEDIKWLREQTGAGIMEAKRALQDAGGERDRAVKLLQERGTAGAAKRAGRAVGEGIVEPYIHSGGQLGSIVEIGSETDFVARMPEFKHLAHEIAMQVAASDPRYVSFEDVPQDEVEEMKTRFREEAMKEGKAENIASNIAEGRIKKYAQQVALLDQPYIRDDSKTVKDLIAELAAKTRENIVVKRFARFQVGE